MLGQAREQFSSVEHEQFVENLNTVCGSFDVLASPEGDTLDCILNAYSKAGLDFACVGQNSKQITRSAQNIRKDPGNHFFLVVQDQGQAQMRQCDSDVQLNPGDMFLVDSTKCSAFHYAGQRSLQISLHLPRDEMMQRYGRRISGGTFIPRKDPLGKAMKSVLIELLKGQHTTQKHVSEAFFGVFGAFLFNRSLGEKSPVNPKRQLVGRALQYMSQHFSDPDFNVAHAAELAGVSLRQLQRAFATQEETPHQTLQRIRLEAASDMINAPAVDNTQSIARIAFECGFNDLSTFYRQYKDRYGGSPKKLS